jgi:methylase of polypeptide subunit release factors
VGIPNAGTTLDAAAAPSIRDRALRDLGAALKDLGYRFITVTPATHERVNRRPENALARGLSDVFGWSRPFPAGLVPDRLMELLAAGGVLERVGDAWRSRVRFSSYDGDLFVHSAFPTAAADAVFLGPDTYRMADAAAAHVEACATPIRTAVDIGCGTGAGAIAVAKRAPQARVVAVDINDTALRYARINATLAGLARVHPTRSDLLDGVDGAFDLIISNPPFMIDPGRRTYRNGGGPDGNELSLKVIDAAADRLAPGGSLVLFSGTGIRDGRDPLHEAAAGRLAGTDLRWTYREVDPDVYGEELETEAYRHAERIAVVVLTATRPR